MPTPMQPTVQAQLRAVEPQRGLAERLGPLRNLPGFWEGPGFGLIARPDASPGSPNGFFLQLNLLHETLEFTTIGSPVFNRGSVQEDIAIYGVTYLHRVTDSGMGGALHIEPGMWLNVPATTAPRADASIARLAAIPHGNAFCTIGFLQEAVFDRIPDIPPANTTPFPIGAQPPAPGTPNPYPEYDLGTPDAMRTDPLPAGITQAMIDDPNQMLRDVLDRQVNHQGMTINWIDRLITRTASPAAVANIPFITANADTPDVESVFAIESLTDRHGNEFLQLQYVQTALLNYRGTSFPHVTVGTLVKAF